MKSQKANFKHLSSKDLELISTLCERVHYTNPNEPFSNHAFVVLKDALSNTHFSVERYRTDPIVLEEALNEGCSSDELDRIHATYVHQHPLIRFLLTLSQSGVRTILTETSVREFKKRDLYAEFYRKLDVEDQLLFKLPHQGGGYVISYSRDRAFTEKEQAIMQVVRPHMQIAWQNWQRIRELEQRLQLLEEKNVISEESAKQARAAKQLMDCLSPREREVAELVSQGMENRQIAETLHIAPKTVGKHLENIFTTLNLHHRAALAAKWRLSSHAN